MLGFDYNILQPLTGGLSRAHYYLETISCILLLYADYIGTHYLHGGLI